MGNAPEPVVLLHGQPGGARDWEPVRAAIGTRAQTIALDRPGWDGRTAPTDLAGNARAALAAMDARGAERATIVGHSFGGAIAAWLAAFHPERVGALVLVAPAANLASLYRLDYWLAAPVVGEVASVVTLAGLSVALTPRRVRGWVAARLALDDRYLETWARLLRAPAVWRAYAAEQRVLTRDLPVLEDRLTSLAAPTTIVAGTHDRVVPAAAAHELAAQIPGAELVLLDHAGHLLLHQQVGRMADLIVAAASARPA